MALFDEKLVQTITDLVRKQHQKLGSALTADKTAKANGVEPSFIENVRLLVEIANGRRMRSDALLQRAEIALEQLLNLLFGNAVDSKAVYPPDFWQSDMGVLVSRVRWWLSVDDLITISNAAALAFGENSQANRMRIARAIDNGMLDWVPDPSVANPQQNRRVLRPQVERWAELQSLP